MAEITVAGPVSGKPYRFRIAGDRPTADEQLRIEGNLRALESQFADQFESQYGERPAGARDGVLDYAGAFFRGIPMGAVGLGETAALGIAGILPERFEDPTRDAIRRGAYAIKPQQQVGMEDTVAGNFGQALGSFVPLLAMSAVPGGAPLALGTAIGAGAGEASERARAAGATEEERTRALMRGAPVGALEMLPIKFMKILGRDGTLTMTQRLMRIGESAGVEGMQEAAAEMAQNLIAQGIYDPDQGVLTGTGESLGYGAGVGGLVQALMDLAIPRTRGPSPTQPPATPMLALPPPAIITPPPGTPLGQPSPSAPTQEGTSPNDAQPAATRLTTETLDQLGVPSTAPLYKRVAAGAVAPGKEIAELERFAEAAVDNANPAISDLAPSVYAYVDFLRQAAVVNPPANVSPTAVNTTNGVGTGDDTGSQRDQGRGAGPSAAGAVTSEPGGLDGAGEPAADTAAAEADVAAPLNLPQQLDMFEPQGAPEPRPALTQQVQQEVESERQLTDDELAFLGEDPALLRAVAPNADPMAQFSDAQPLPQAQTVPAPVAAPVAPPSPVVAEAAPRAQVAPQAAQAVYDPMSGAVPGQPTGAAGQVIPAPVAPAAVPQAAQAPLASPAVQPTPQPTNAPAAVAQQIAAEADAAVTDAIAREFYESDAVSTDLKVRTAGLGQASAETIPLSTPDKTRILNLIRSRITRGKGKKRTPEFLAYEYFRKHPDPGTAMLAMAYDLSDPTVPDFRTRDNIVDKDDMMTPEVRADIEYFANTGRKAAAGAMQWVEANLSPDATMKADDAIGQLLSEARSDRQMRADQNQTNAVQKARKQARAANDAQFGVDSTSESDAADLGFASERLDIYDLSNFSLTGQAVSHLHPRVAEYIRRGDVVSALRTLAVTAPNLNLRKLARRLIPFAQNTRTRVVSEAEMFRVTSVLNPALAGDEPGGVRGAYIQPLSTEERLNFELEGHTDAIELIDSLSGDILLEETAGMNPMTFLHEMVHVATAAVATNKNHPLTKRLDALLVDLRAKLGDDHYGLYDANELLAEGMTTPYFRELLSRVKVDGEQISAWQRFTNDIRNFLRRLMGLPPKDVYSARTEVDAILDEIIALSPMDAGYGNVLGSAFRPRGSAKVLASIKDKVRVPTKEDARRISSLMQNTSVPPKWKNTFMRLAMPLDYVAENAKKYFPSARKVFDLIHEHAGEQKRMTELVTNTTKDIAAWVTTNPDKVDLFNRTRFEATRFEVDPRDPRSAYEGYSYKYDILDSTGGVVRTMESPRFKTMEQKDAAKRAHNKNVNKNRSLAADSFVQDSGQLEVYDRVRKGWNELGPDGQAAMKRAFELPVELSKGIADAVKARLDALLPSQAGLQQRIYGSLYEKLFAGQVIKPYQGLNREGEYWLSYVAKTDEGTDIYKHSFQSANARMAAIEQLQNDPTVQAITPYQKTSTSYDRPTVPLNFVADVLNKLQGSGELSDSVKQQIVEMVFDSAPETSFIQSFRKRQGTRGFIGDVTPLSESLSPGDTMENIQRSGLSTAKQAADIRYGAKFAQLRSQLETENQRFQEGQGVKDPKIAAQESAEAQVYFGILNDATQSAFTQRSDLSRNLTSAGYALTLGFNASTALITMAQIPMFVAPFLGGRYGMRNTVQAIGSASRMLAGMGGTRRRESVSPDGGVQVDREATGFFDYSIDNPDLMQDSRMAFLQELQDTGRRNGLFTRSLTQDILEGQAAEGPTSTFRKLVAKSGIFQHYAERYSRETSLIASYLLDLQKAAKDANYGDFSLKQLASKLQDGSLQLPSEMRQRAADTAVTMTERTNGSLYAATAPMASQSSLGAVVYLFKRHPLSMMNLVMNTMKRSIVNADPEDKRIAQYQAGSMLGMIALFSGSLGMPFMQQVGWLYDMFAEDDDPDFETIMRHTIGDVGSYGLVDYLTGLNISQRVGMGDAFYRPGFASENLPLPFKVLEGIGGPVVGLTLKYTDRVTGLYGEGEFQRGTEAVLPSSLANIMRAIRFGTEGVRTQRFDPIVDDFGPYDLMMQAMGFMPAQYARQLSTNASASRINRAINSQRTGLLGKRYRAFAQGDFQEISRIDREIEEFNAKHPYNPITAETKATSLKSHKRTTSEVINGVQYNPNNMPRIRELLSDFGPATIWE